MDSRRNAPLAGAQTQLRLSYAGSFDDPIYITLNFAQREVQLQVVHLGADLRVALGCPG